MNARVPAVPLITNDPYFSAWSPSNALYESDITHWTGASNRMNGNILIDGEGYRFMGLAGAGKTMMQTGLTITATSSKYAFEGGGVALDVVFTSPLLLSDLTLVSRPCTYVDFRVRSTDDRTHGVSVLLDMDESFCHNFDEPQLLTGGVHPLAGRDCAWTGLRRQTPLGHSGDLIKINWGYLYLCGSETGYSEDIDALRHGRLGLSAPENAGPGGLYAAVDFGEVTAEPGTRFLTVAYDDLLSIQYFGDAKKAYWADDGTTILEAIGDAVNGHDSILTRCDIFDEKLRGDAVEIAGEEYAAICALAYRQTIAAHKLIRDNDGKLIFLSKECHSNGCIGTVDVSYPSVPLYLMHNPELVKGMLRPVLKFAKLPVWEYDFAPHDVGRYPYAWGQVYGRKGPAKGHGARFANGDVYPNYYTFPAGSDIYTQKHQMPVEECGNMLVMIAAVLKYDARAIDEFKADMPLLEKWAGYLIKYGEDPGEQLCTDDFAGHLAHNVNLSVKAIMGVASMGLIKTAAGAANEGAAYLRAAKQMAGRWESRFEGMDHTPLTFTDMDTWGLKYNMVWDRIFGLDLFSDGTYLREIACYKKRLNKYGVPLDNRKDYTKSDWILWCAAFADSKEDRIALINPVYRFICESPDRVPFSDWYDTATGAHHNFINRTVQGGLFMPMLRP